MLPHWIDNTISVNGAAIHYTRTGDGSKPPLVLAHGFSDNGLCWLPVARDLEAEYDVILPDARGHGLSARVQPGETLDQAADLAGLIRALGLSQPIVGGHSMGAATSAQMESRFTGLARALVLEDPPWRGPEPTPDPAKPRSGPPTDWLTPLRALTLEALIARGRADNPTWPEIELGPWAESKLQFDMNFTQALRPSRIEWPEVVSGIRCPTLLITADPAKGAIVPPEVAQETAAMNGQIRVAQITNAGHSIRRENYPAYLDAVKRFLKEVG